MNTPFWRDWPHADPSLFLAVDTLHQTVKFLSDHLVEWGTSLLKNDEFDRRLALLQPRVGFRHFPNGYTRFKQHTGKETKELLSVFIGIVAGHENITDGVMIAMRSLIEFFLMEQYQSHSEETLGYLQSALDTFHQHKQHIADAGLRAGPQRRNNFNIPKLEQKHHVVRLIQLLGSAPQFSTEQIERSHITAVKET